MQRFHIKPGDHIYYSCGLFEHHGIFCGDILGQKNVVIHLEGKHQGGKIKNISYKKFSKEREIHVQPYKQGNYDNPSVVIYRAMNKLGHPDYNLFGNNCEHFAHWCKTGKKACGQINEAIEIGGAVLGTIAVGALLPLAIPGVIGTGIAGIAGATIGKLGEGAAQLFTGSPDYED